MNAPDPRVKTDIEAALRSLDGVCPHVERFRHKQNCTTCQADAAYTAVLTFVSRENANAIRG